MINLSKKTFLVTGASSGIGRAACQMIDKCGGNVILVGRNIKSLLETNLVLNNINYIEEFDFNNTENIESWFEEINKKCGAISGIIHCAGIQIITPLKITTISDIEMLMKINVNSGLILAKCFRKKGYHTPKSSLVYISSIMGCVGAELRSAYCASKGAVISMTKSLAIELVRDDIRVNCISPGFVKTNMLYSTNKIIGDESIENIKKLHPLGFGEPEDIANSIVFLLSDMSKWITGINLIVDGGYTSQ